jgi:hypothetical protein
MDLTVVDALVDAIWLLGRPVDVAADALGRWLVQFGNGYQLIGRGRDPTSVRRRRCAPVRSG